MNKKIIIFVVAALLSAGQAFAGGQNHFGINRLSQLMGMDVKSSNGDKIGEVSDAILDRNGNVSYIVVSQGGVLGMGDRLIPIPVSAFQKGDGNDVILNINLSTDRSRLDSAPYFTSSQWPNFDDPTWDQQVRGYYKSAGAESTSPGVSGSGSLGRSPSGNSGTSSGAAK